MKTSSKLSIIALFLGALIFSPSCKKKAKPTETAPVVIETLPRDILNELSANVITATYQSMATRSQDLYASVLNFNANTTAANHSIIKDNWLSLRNAWEQSEGFLFGPIAVENIDPRIDTWPIDFARIDSVLATSVVLNPTYVDNLEDALKGFHPIEYLIWGVSGNKTFSQFTAREKEFMLALAENLKTLCLQVGNSWNTGFTQEFYKAGQGSTTYTTQQAAFEELIDAISGICDEVGGGKIYEPYNLQNPNLEESPFSQNSLNDFKNNMKSVQNIYLGIFNGADGKGLEDLIRANNLSMDGEIKVRINNVLNSFNNITVPFGQAIVSQQTQVQNCINAITELKVYLDETVKPFVQTLID